MLPGAPSIAFRLTGIARSDAVLFLRYVYAMQASYVKLYIRYLLTLWRSCELRA